MRRIAIVLAGLAIAAASAPAMAQRAAGATCGVAAGLGYCRHEGGTPVIVLMPGLGNSMRSWPAPMVDALARVSGVLLYDRRGHGRSALPAPSPVTATAVADDLVELLDRLAIRQPVVLVGHSLGGLYAQYFARNHPARAAAVVLLDAASPFEPVGDPAFRTRAALPPGSVDDLENRGIDASVLATRASPPFPDIPLIVISATDHASPPALEAAWQKIQAETATQSPRGRLVVAEGSGHDVHVDRTDLVLRQVRAVVDELRAASPGQRQ